jgi:hypothetical protein
MSFYNADFSSLRRNRFDQFQQALARILSRRQSADTAYQSGASQLDIEKPNVLRNVLNNFAGRGMAYSSGYGTEVQNTNTDFANRLASLASARNAEQTAADLDQGQETANYSYDLADYQNQQAAYEAQQQQQLVAAQAAQQEQQARIAAIRAQAQRASAPSNNTRQGTYRRQGTFRGLRRRL